MIMKNKNGFCVDNFSLSACTSVKKKINYGKSVFILEWNGEIIDCKEII